MSDLWSDAGRCGMQTLCFNVFFFLGDLNAIRYLLYCQPIPLSLTSVIFYLGSYSDNLSNPNVFFFWGGGIQVLCKYNVHVQTGGGERIHSDEETFGGKCWRV
jgi:hypothetical protein